MKRFQSVVVYLSLRATDAAVLAWASNVARLAGAKRLTLVHAWQPIDLPAELRTRYPWLLEPGEQVATERMEFLAGEHLAVDASVGVHKRILQGPPFGAVLAAAEEADADLVVCGRANDDPFLCEKLARKAPCSVLSVPEGAGTDFRRVLAAVDYSEFSREALDVAFAFAHAGGAEPTVFHAFEVPWGQGRTTIAREDFVSGLRSFHDERLRAFATSVETHGLTPHIRLRESALPPAAIALSVNAEQHDLVVIGCRGHDAIYATLLGSTAEAILRGCPAPVVAVKAKGSQRSFLAALRAV